MKRVLIVDDNDRYAEVLTADLESRGATVLRAYNAAEGVELLRQKGAELDGVVTDISMETQISGLKVLRMARKIRDFTGTVTCATTGLDTPISFFLNQFFLGKLYRCDFIIPKRPIKKEKKVIWIKG